MKRKVVIQAKGGYNKSLLILLSLPLATSKKYPIPPFTILPRESISFLMMGNMVKGKKTSVIFE